MCCLVNIRGVWVNTVGEIRQALAIEPVRDSCYHGTPRDEDCLCGIDLAATLTAAGLFWAREDCGDYHAYDSLNPTIQEMKE